MPVLNISSDLRFFLKLSFFFLVMAGVLFSNSLKNPFMLDDHDFFDSSKKNSRNLLEQFIPDKEKKLNPLAGKESGYYRPLAHIVPSVGYLIFKDNVWGHHVFNLILFWIAHVAIFWFLLSLTDHRWLATTATFLFLIHPVNGLLVNFITASVFSVQLILLSVSCGAFLKFLKSEKKGKLLWWMVSLIAYLISLLCHETSMPMPVYLGALVFVTSTNDIKRQVCAVIPFWIVMFFYFWLRLNVASLNESVFQNYVHFNMSFLEYFATLSRLIFWYLGKLFIPVGIVMIWATPVIKNFVLGWSVVLLMLVGITFITVLKKATGKLVKMALIFFGLGLLPLMAACLYQPTRGVIVEPHWFLFSSIGFFLLVAHSFFIVFQKFRENRWVRKGVFAGIILTVVAWIVWGRWYNTLWGDEKKYCEHWIKESPQFKGAVMFHLAKWAQINGLFDDVEFYYRQGVTAHPADRLKYYNETTLIDFQQGRWLDAQKKIVAALKINPHSAAALTAMGILKMKDRQLSEALSYFQKSTQSDRYAIAPRLNIAKIYQKQGEVDRAIQAYQEILTIVPQEEISMVELLKIYLDRKDKNQVIALSLKLLSFSKNPVVLSNLGEIFEYYRMQKEAQLARKKLEGFSKDDNRKLR